MIGARDAVERIHERDLMVTLMMNKAVCNLSIHQLRMVFIYFFFTLYVCVRR